MVGLHVIEYLLRVPWVWGFPWGFQWGIPVGMGWVWGLKCHPHGSPVKQQNIDECSVVPRGRGGLGTRRLTVSWREQVINNWKHARPTNSKRCHTAFFTISGQVTAKFIMEQRRRRLKTLFRQIMLNNVKYYTRTFTECHICHATGKQTIESTRKLQTRSRSRVSGFWVLLMIRI